MDSSLSTSSPKSTSDIRETARLISRVEAGDPDVRSKIRDLYRNAGRAKILGISGPPGAGKSTLVDQLVALYRQRGTTVAVVAVDPSSPYTGGALLGDRVRMSRHTLDPGVYIRSLAARGALGGVTAATSDVLTILDAMGWNVIILETVGVGQNEVAVMQAVPNVVLVQNPGDGDGVQAIKAGALEIANVFVVNKSDMPGAKKVVQDIKEMLGHKTRQTSAGWEEPIVLTQANSGDGVASLLEAIESRFAFLAANPSIAREEERKRICSQIVDLVSQSVLRKLSGLSAESSEFKSSIDSVLDRSIDPRTIAEALLKDVLTQTGL